MSPKLDQGIRPSLEPQERLRQLINFSNQVEVDPHVAPRKYYRSGVEMVRMANVYYSEGSLENAYVLYLKFMTLFLEKIRKHPEFNTVPSNVKILNQAKLREVLPKAEKLKELLLEQYQQEYNRYIAELKQLHKESDGKPKRQEAVLKPHESKSDYGLVSIMSQPVKPIDSVQYPDPNIAIDIEKPMPSQPPIPPHPTPIPSVKEPPSVDRSKKPTETRYDTTTLRSVIVPMQVMTLFQSMAATNTINNIETCGVLAGKLEKNELKITDMILPKQKGTSDSCTTMNEEEIFDYQDQHNLITIGWIHTHPTQTAFLSSVDLHTHCPYQLLMPEAIAIVCAPKYNETGFFILTPNHGLQFIANCRKSGFHPHPTDPPLFMVAEHVQIDKTAQLQVLDLRNK